MAEDERKSSGSFGSEVGKLGKKYRDYNPAKVPQPVPLIVKHSQRYGLWH